VKRLLALLALALAGLGAWAWWSSDARRIDRRLDALVEACGKSGPDSPLDLLGRTQTILDSFAPSLLVRAEPYGVTVRDGRELASLIHRYRATASRAVVSVGERELALGANRTAEMTARFRVLGDSGSGPRGEEFRARLYWVEEGGAWRIREVEVTERLTSSGLFF
jgi:hypothetical protein